MDKLTELYAKWEEAEQAYLEACRFKERVDRNCSDLFKAVLTTQRELYMEIQKR